MERRSLIILDTHAWIWWINSPEELGRDARRALSTAKRIGVSAISCWEFALLVARGRIRESDPLNWIEEALAQPRIEILPLSPAVAVRAAGIGPPADPADRIIMATAILEAVPLITRDESIRSHPSLKTIW